LRYLSSANTASLNVISLATPRKNSKLGQQARNHLRRVPCFETSIGVYKFGLRPLKPVCYRSAINFGVRALYASPPILNINIFYEHGTNETN
jgi:hypothetical protein